jgi:cytochrome c
VMMPAHPQLSEAEASRIAAYVLSLGENRAPSLPVRGAYAPPVAPDSARQGVVVLRAAYTDRGANGVPSASAEKAVVLRAPSVVVASGDTADGVQKYKGPEVPVEVTIGSRSGAFVAFKQLDLTGVSAVVFSAMAPVQHVNSAGGKVEVRLDSADGPLVGETEVIQPVPAVGAPTQLRAALRPTAGVHDVYFVFRNAQAEGGRSLFILLTATFESGAGSRARAAPR